MGRYVIFVPLLAALAGCPPPMHPPTPVSYSLRTEKKTRAKYYIYTPSYYSDKRDWPLVVTLHGTVPWDPAVGQIVEWKYIAEKHGLIVVAPWLKSVQGIMPVYRPWWYRDLDRDERKVLAVMDEVCEQYPIAHIASRPAAKGRPAVKGGPAVLLTGFSAGGYPLYHVGLRNPGRFDMLIARACNSSIGLFERVKLTDEARKLPILIYWGKDDLGPIQKESWQAFRYLRERGFSGTERHEIEGGHLRRPGLAYRFWRPRLPRRLRRD